MPALPFRRRLTWVVFAACLILNLVFVTTRGAWESDLAGDPDEAAHAVTSLMLRDYLAGGWRQPPMAFANQYYADFPKVALGHYPPGYYLLAGVWLLPAASAPSLLVLQAALGAALCAVLYRLVSKAGGARAGIVAAALMALLPTGLKQMQLVMSDTLLVVLGLTAALIWRDYLNRPTARRAVGFGLVTAAAILTKGSAMGLCVIPPLATLLSGRLALLKRLSWWLSGLPVLLLAAPWMLYSSKITAEGMLHLPLAEFLPEAAAYYLKALPHALGWPLALLAPAGLALALWQGRGGRGEHAATAAVLGALACGTLLIILLVPAGLTERYLFPAMPVLMAGAPMVTGMLWHPGSRGQVIALLAVLAAALPMVGWPKKQVSGFSAAVARAEVPNQVDQRQTSWLVASDPRGEGAVIAATAFALSQRSPSPLRVYRGSKELAASDWMGRGYQPAFDNADSLLAHLDKRGITCVFLDLSAPESQRKAHEKLLQKSLDHSKAAWALVFEQPVIRSPGQNGWMRVYKRL
jgi:4-amino-4-deoxy-L-arabinose transferase-like glycosyltransferase